MSYVVSQPSEGSLADTLEDLAASGQRDLVLVSAAYATRAGVDQLAAILQSNRELWINSQKLFLVGLDFGLTEPSAIEALAAIPNADVRVFQPGETLAANLNPSRRFHPKVYGWAAGNWDAPTEIVLVVGSNNLTRSGLFDNEECFTVSDSDVGLESSFSHLVNLALMQPSSTAAILSEYTSLRATIPAEPPARAGSRPAKPLPVPVQRNLRMARWFWTDTLKIVQNRGKGVPGNQLDLTKGARAFFGFKSMNAPPNSELGEVMIQLSGNPPQVCHMRYGNNHMDKITLPIIHPHPVSYDNTCLIFERTNGHFLLGLATAKQRADIAARSNQNGSLFKYGAGSSREWGFLS